jgi:hypothetical protein
MKQDKEIGYYNLTPKKETLKQVAEKFAEGVDGVIVKTNYVYTETDLRKAIFMAQEWKSIVKSKEGSDVDFKYHFQEIIQSINQIKLQEQ